MLIYLLIALSSLSGLSLHAATICDDTDTNCLREQMRNHVVMRAGFWTQYASKKIEDRIFSAPPELIDYITLNNRKDGFPERPKTVSLDKDFEKDLRAAWSGLPELVKKKIEGKFAGVFLLQDLGGTGYTDLIKSDKEPQLSISSYIVLDVNKLSKNSANAWMTLKEKTPFREENGFSIEATIENEESNTRQQAIQYVFLHELGHAISVGDKIHPEWDAPRAKIGGIKGFQFYDFAWSVQKDDFISKYDQNIFPDRKKVVYYLGAKLSVAESVKIYKALEKTGLPTLYAATNPFDDWADSFASYVHVVLMKKPYRIDIKKNGKVLHTYSSCWGKPRCSEREKFLKDYLGLAI